MITAQNFARIETDDQGRQVLFWVEHDGEDCNLHQILEANVGTVDIKVTLPADKMDKLWPDKVHFDTAVEQMRKTVYDMGLGWGEEVSDA